MGFHSFWIVVCVHNLRMGSDFWLRLGSQRWCCLCVPVERFVFLVRFKNGVCVGIAEVLTRVHIFVCEYMEFVEFLFESCLWNSLCMEYDLRQGGCIAIKEVWCG